MLDQLEILSLRPDLPINFLLIADGGVIPGFPGQFESFGFGQRHASEFIEIRWLETATDDCLPGRFEFGMSVDEESPDERGDELAAFAR